jgi:hypothetical protein
MSDGLTLATLVGGALGGAAGNLLSDGAKRAAPVIWRGLSGAVQEAMQRALPQARQRFEENAAGFVAALADETAPADDPDAAERRAETIARQLEDPDVAVAVADALRAAGRSSEPDRHRALAKVVAARLDAPPDSGRAAAANLAVRAMETLGASTCASSPCSPSRTTSGRPNPSPPTTPASPSGPAARSAPGRAARPPARRSSRGRGAQQRGSAPSTRRRRVRAPPRRAAAARARTRGRPAEIPESVTTHLLASACLIPHASHPSCTRRFRRVIEPPPPIASMADRAPEHAISRYF